MSRYQGQAIKVQGTKILIGEHLLASANSECSALYIAAIIALSFIKS